MGFSPIITLLPENMARKGVIFVSGEAGPECTRCKLRRVCIENLKPGHVYRVVRARRMTHKCPIYGTVRVVEVEEAEFEVAVEPRLAMPGAIIKYRPIKCPFKLCPHYRSCSPEFIRGEIRVKILEVRGSLECPRGLRLRLVLVRAVD